MKCKLCQNHDADKKNTHYLTDKIIRSCLNVDGVNDREKGFTFDMSTGNPFIGFGFQRETSPELVEKALGREPTNEEIQEAKKNAFSVDYVFCKSCEDRFTAIEQEFIDTILDKLRGHDFKGIPDISFSEKIIIKKFFLMQVWRTSVSIEGFPLSDSLKEDLRKIIFEANIDDSLVISVPLTVTYLNTVGDDSEFTKNLVGHGNIEGSPVIFFNDFVIQVFEKDRDAKFIELYGINDEVTFQKYINKDEDAFTFRIFDNESRLRFSGEYFRQEKVGSTLSFFAKIFEKQYAAFYGHNPTKQIVKDFLNGITTGDDCTEETRYSMERFVIFTNKYFEG